MRRWKSVLAGAIVVTLLAIAFWFARGSCAIASWWPDSATVEAAEKVDLDRRLNQLLEETTPAGTAGPLAMMRLVAISRTTATIRVRDVDAAASDFRAGQRWQVVYSEHHDGVSPCVQVVFATLDGRRSARQLCCEVPLPRR